MIILHPDLGWQLGKAIVSGGASGPQKVSEYAFVEDD